jgi:ABC-type phosphate transport system substrate-binding protein
MRGYLLRLAPIATALALTLTAPARGSAPPAPYLVIVHKDRPETSLDRRFLSRVFLKKATTWDDGQGVHPVDQASDARVRQRFSEEVIGRSVAAVRNYWQQLIFTGRGVPPPELDSDDAVVRFVTRHPGAVGYVSGDANLLNAKVIGVR